MYRQIFSAADFQDGHFKSDTIWSNNDSSAGEWTLTKIMLVDDQGGHFAASGLDLSPLPKMTYFIMTATV